MLHKDYYRLGDVADAWRCTVDDILHHFLHGRINLGVVFHQETLHGLNNEFETVGIYSVSGVLSPPRCIAETWELGDDTPTEAGGFAPHTEYPPDIHAACYMDESEFPAPWPWAAGRNHDNPETDHDKIAMFVVSPNRLITIKRTDLVVHAAERTRIESMPGFVVASQPTPGRWAHDALLNRWWPKEEQEEPPEDSKNDAKGPTFEGGCERSKNSLPRKESPLKTGLA
ncbi:hypothetical protein ABC977_11985 [Thioalkalicoccus limnaeus]|uniref:Uncharacterized protein n=1 Tax=Thioalkalicoccus limnaeus TaxID=120681 RepID=A0ABV4BF07_9GAMM